VGPRTGLDDVEKRKFLTLPGHDSDPSVDQPAASRQQYENTVPINKTKLPWQASWVWKTQIMPSRERRCCFYRERILVGLAPLLHKSDLYCSSVGQRSDGRNEKWRLHVRF
jgi:hypothetical protein